MKYATIIRFNGRAGGRSVLAATYEAESVVEALEMALAALNAYRCRFITGLSVDEVPE